MTTVASIVKTALVKINAQNPAQPVKAQDMADGIAALNRMVARWEADGTAIGWAPVSGPGDTLPAPVEAEDAIIYNLAVRLAPDFGVTVAPEVSGPAITFYNDLLRDQATATPIRPILAVPIPSEMGFAPGVSPWFYAG